LFHLPSQKQIPQHNGVVMNLVVSRVHERDRALSCQGSQPVELFTMLVDRRSVAAAKLLPAGGIVAEPFPQRGADAIDRPLSCCFFAIRGAPAGGSGSASILVGCGSLVGYVNPGYSSSS
jgi:hypothetical protein